jgi:hypothetical protein
MRPLVERFVNLFDTKEKEKYADEVWNMLQKSYEKVGGIHGSGFNDKQDMIKNMPFWKLAKRNGKLVAVALYKDKQGRKRVASGTDGTPEGKDQLERIGREDITQERAFAEVSSASLNFILKRWKGLDITKYMTLPRDAEKILGVELEYPVPDDDQEVLAHPELKKYFYRRQIGGSLHTKLMIGKPGQKM